MHNLAVAINSFASNQEVAVVASSKESLSIAALLSANGSNVQFKALPNTTMLEQLIIKGNTNNYKAGKVHLSRNSSNFPDMYLPTPGLIVVSAKNEAYDVALDYVANMVQPGQTVFIIDAPIAASFELSCRIFKLRKRMALNLIEAGPLFEEFSIEKSTLTITDFIDQVFICGRSINETRSALSIGRNFFHSLVPASNVLERALAEGTRILINALRLILLAKYGQNDHKSEMVSLTKAEFSTVENLQSEIQSLGKIFNVNVQFDREYSKKIEVLFQENLNRQKEEVRHFVSNNLVLLANLAELAYLTVPALDSIIELSSITLGVDFRKSGRNLSHLGLAGMDLFEIIEFINS